MKKSIHWQFSLAVFIAFGIVILPAHQSLAAENSMDIFHTHNESLIENRSQQELNTEQNPFALLPHKPNYIMPLTYTKQPNQQPWQSFVGTASSPVQKYEFRFQISLKTAVIQDLWLDGATLYTAYSQKSFWQVYNGKLSSPFRETNFNPEIFYRMKHNYDVMGFKIRRSSIGLEHESNGREDPVSRSWNRLYISAFSEKENLILGAKLWYRIPETSVDNNPDIAHYMGYSELYAHYKYGESRLGLMLRPALSKELIHGVQFDWSYAFLDRFQGYVQYFHGFGESLIDYNHRNNSVGIGIMLNNWF